MITKYEKILSDKEIMKLLRKYKLSSISSRTGIPKSTLKNYKYGRIEIEKMPIYIVKRLTRIITNED